MSQTGSRFPGIPSSRRLWAEYVLAVGAVLMALALRWVLSPFLGVGAVPFLTVSAALLLLVLLVRTGPFLVATAVAGLGVLVLFLEPSRSPSMDRVSTMVQLALFGLVGLAAGGAAWLARRAAVRRFQAEAELARRSDEIRLVTDAMPALISYVGADRRYRFVNARYADAASPKRPAE